MDNINMVTAARWCIGATEAKLRYPDMRLICLARHLRWQTGPQLPRECCLYTSRQYQPPRMGIVYMMCILVHLEFVHDGGSDTYTITQDIVRKQLVTFTLTVVQPSLNLWATNILNFLHCPGQWAIIKFCTISWTWVIVYAWKIINLSLVACGEGGIELAQK